MPRIKGWVLMGHYANGVSEWRSQRGRSIMVVDTKRDMKTVYSFQESDEHGFFDKTEPKYYKTRKEANQAAVRYMKRNPRG